MTQRTIFICDEDLWARAEAWAQAGLVGRSLWLVAPDGPVGEPITTPARSLPDGATGSLGDFLGAEAFVEALLVWCAPSGGDELARHPWTVEGLAALRTSLGMQTLNSVAVFPAVTGSVELPWLSANWARIVVAPEESILPARSQVGTRDDQGRLLLTALAVGGAVGGHSGERREALASAGWWDAEVCAATYASTVVGGGRLDAAAASYYDDELPRADAASISPMRYDRSKADLLLDTAHDAVINEGTNPLRRLDTNPAELRFEENERIGFVEFFRRFWAFVGFLAFHSRRVSFWGRMRDMLANRLQGWNSGFEVEGSGEVPGEIPVVDFPQLDAEHCDHLSRRWREEQLKSGELPSAEALQALTAATNGMIDGSDLPVALPRPSEYDRLTVVPPERVVGCATVDGELAPSAAEAPVAIAGVTYQPASEAVVASARSLVRQQLRKPSEPLARPSRRGSGVVGQLISEISGADDAGRRKQLAEFEADKESVRLSFLDRLRASVLADAVKAHLDADRWFAIASGPLNGLRELRAALFRFLFIGAGVLTAALVLGNLLFQRDLLSLLAGIGLSLTAGQLKATSAGVGVVLVSGPVIWYFYHYEGYMTRGIRQAEARTLMYRRARGALEEHRRLAAGERLLRLWSIVLRGVYPLREVADAADAEAADPQLPHSWTVVKAKYTADQLENWLETTATASPWRQRAFEEIASRYARRVGLESAQLYRDHGLDESPLDQLADRIGELWEEFRRERLDAVGQELRNCVMAASSPVSPEGTGELSLEEFLHRVDVPGTTPGLGYGRATQEAPQAMAFTVGPQCGAPTEEVIASSAVVYQRRLRPASRPTHLRAPQPVDTDERI